MTPVCEAEVNAVGKNREVAAHRVPWTYPATVVVGRSVFILLAQAVVAAIFAFRGVLHPRLAAPWHRTGILVLCLIYLRIRRLPPLILAHWTMDIIACVMTTA